MRPVNLLFGSSLDGAPCPSNWMGPGRLVCGPEGLLNSLEVALGLPPQVGISEIERLISYREAVEFGERLPWKGNPDPGTVGDAMHRIFAVEILNPESDEGTRLKRISDLLVGFNLESHLDPSEVAATVDRYRAFVKEQFSPISEQVEVPFSYLNELGQCVSGFIDHLLETAEGPVILDHKIFPGQREDWEAKALSYSGQLDAYVQALSENGTIRCLIHLVTNGATLELMREECAD